ncbi:MAG TPA: transglycosylase, partial [Methylophaga sp.]|nr:transglycosylase [Methylophaga sp.]
MNFIKSVIFGSLWLLLLPAFAHATDNKSSSVQRSIFQQAHNALNTHQISKFNTLKQQLEDYPLQPYLDYLYLRHRLSHTKNSVITQFLSDNQDTFYADRLRNIWLDRLAKNKKWQTFLDNYQQSQSISRQCLRLQALIATDRQEEAFAEIPALWLVPRSQHKACDPAFKIWQDHGLLTDELRWQRIRLSLQDNQFSLATFLAKPMQDSDSVKAWISRWQKMHHNPLSLLKQLPGMPPASKQTVSLFQDIDISREIIQHGIARLSRKSTDQAFENWQRIQPTYRFSEQEKLFVQRDIARRSALRHEERALEFFGDIPAEPWRVRAALWQQDWHAVQQAIFSLNHDQQQSPRWQYWLSRSQIELDDELTAYKTFQILMADRDYYAFLSADQLDRPYQMNHNPIVFTQDELDKLAQHPAVTRLREFYVLNMTIESRRQAYKLIQTLSMRDLELLAILTYQWNWYNQTIALLGKAKYWDALNLRFPIVYDTAILKAGKKNGIDPSWLFGIARQESAFNPNAHSHVGAAGLMQLMPKTGKLIARLINRPMKRTSELLNPDRNIQLGSAYLRRMYDKNQHNPVLATASYNAGPHRVKGWLPEQEMSADIWIENIPFDETRKYTRNVLSYAAVFDY